MKNPIPYTSSAFNKILRGSRVFHNNHEIDSNNIRPYISDKTTNDNSEFIQGLVNEIDIFIQSNLYDVDLRQKLSIYIDSLLVKWGQFIKKSHMQYISQLDVKYHTVLKSDDFIQRLFIPRLYNNVMICD